MNAFPRHRFADFLDAATGDMFAVETNLEALQDVEAIAHFSVSRGIVYLDSVKIGSKHFTPAFAREWLGDAQIAALLRLGRDAWDDGISAAAFEAMIERNSIE